MSKKKIGGIVLLVLFGLSMLGGLANGSFASMLSEGFDLANLVTVGIEIAMLAGGIHLIKSNE